MSELSTLFNAFTAYFFDSRDGINSLPIYTVWILVKIKKSLFLYQIFIVDILQQNVDYPK